MAISVEHLNTKTSIRIRTIDRSLLDLITTHALLAISLSEFSAQNKISNKVNRKFKTNLIVLILNLISAPNSKFETEEIVHRLHSF